MIARQTVPSHQVGAEQEALRAPADQSANFIAASRDFAHLPFRGAGIEQQVRVAFQQRFEMIGMLRIAAHVGSDPGDLRELLQHEFEAGVLFQLGAEFRAVGIHGAKPGVGVGDMNHEDAHASGDGTASAFDPP